MEALIPSPEHRGHAAFAQLFHEQVPAGVQAAQL
jgi:hypothetical protein